MTVDRYIGTNMQIYAYLPFHIHFKHHNQFSLCLDQSVTRKLLLYYKCRFKFINHNNDLVSVFLKKKTNLAVFAKYFTSLEVDGKFKHYDNKATLSDVSKIWKPDFSLKQPKRTVYECDCGANVFKP